jgi:hypothetical protein
MTPYITISVELADFILNAIGFLSVVGLMDGFGSSICI